MKNSIFILFIFIKTSNLFGDFVGKKFFKESSLEEITSYFNFSVEVGKYDYEKMDFGKTFVKENIKFDLNSQQDISKISIFESINNGIIDLLKEYGNIKYIRNYISFQRGYIEYIVNIDDENLSNISVFLSENHGKFHVIMVVITSRLDRKAVSIDESVPAESLYIDLSEFLPGK